MERRWTFSDMDQLNTAVNLTLRATMLNERCKRWQKVVESYIHLLWMIDTKNLPDEYEPPSSYHMFLYEIYYHLGVAYQHIGKYRKSVKEFTNAIDIVSIPKNGCLAGCITNTCLMTPLYTRRAFACAKLGDYPSSHRDAEKAVVLDSKNPDVYCVRAMVEKTANNVKQAQKDIDIALHLKPSHHGALILNKNISNRNEQMFSTLIRVETKAEKTSESYLHVSDFNHPTALEFYDKFLVPLSVPHTITHIDLTPDKPSKTLLEKTFDQNNVERNRPSSCQSVRSEGNRPLSSQSVRSEPFRCGTPTIGGNKSVTRRRYDYGNALQKHLTRPKTSADYFAQLEKDRRTQSLREEQASRRAISSLSSGSRPSPAPHIRPGKPAATQTTLLQDCDDKTVETTVTRSNGREVSSFTFRMPNTYTIQVFQEVNIKHAPRMYYKPWKGDKLPVAELKKRIPIPVFY